MPSEIRVVESKFYYETRNGSDFTENLSDITNHLKGGVLERVKAVHNVQVQWWHRFNGSGAISVRRDSSNDTYIINAQGVNFANDGFAIGDRVKHSDSMWKIEGTISSIKVGELYLTNATVTDGVPNFTDDTWNLLNDESWLTGLGDELGSQKTAIKYKFGLIENSESFNTLSKLTNTDQIFLIEGIDHSSPLTFSDGISFGNNKAWVTGTARAAFVGYSIDKDLNYPENTVQEFQIEHDFRINPFYRDGDIDSLKGLDNPPLDIFNGDKSLKYVFEGEFRTEINNPNTSMVAEYETQEGSVGYFDESFNGFPSKYSTQSLTYQVDGNVVDKIESSKVTSVSLSITTNASDFNLNDFLVVGHSSIINSSKYTNSTSDQDTLWNNETLRVGLGEGLVDGDIIKNFEADFVSSTTISVSFDVDLTSKTTEDGQDYIIYYTIENSAVTPDLSGKVTGLIDVNQYYKNSDVTGLWDIEKFEQYPHAEPYEEGVTSGFTNAKGFNETGYFLDSSFLMPNVATLQSLKFEYVVFNSNSEEFKPLRSYDIDLSEIRNINTLQFIDESSERGYILTDTDFMNLVTIKSEVADPTFNRFKIQFGYKTPWQNWLEIRDMFPDFFDTTKDFDGFNSKSSEYSQEVVGFDLRVVLRSEIEFGGVVTEYVTSSETIDVWDYDTDDQTPDGFSCEINTYDKNGEQLLNNIVEKEFTEFRAEFTPENPPSFSESVDFSEVATEWGRFAHGNKLLAPATISPREGVWANFQANDTDTFSDSNAVPYTKNDASLYTSSASEINTLQNLNAIYGLYSNNEYEFYSISGEIFSNDTQDNDGLIYNIAFHIDEQGIESTLSLVATTGGVLLDLNPSYVPNDDQTSTIGYQNDFAQWGLVYNYGKDDCKQLAIYKTTESGLNWGSPSVEDLFFSVNRSAAEIEVVVDWRINSIDFSNTFNYNLNDDSSTVKFLGFQRIGFSFLSQNQGGFKNVELTLPSSDYYSILRIEPENASSDFAISELSTVREAPERSLLKQITGTERKASLSWNGEKFIVQGLVNTDNIKEGETYKFSAELRTLNLDDSITL